MKPITCLLLLLAPACAAPVGGDGAGGAIRGVVAAGAPAEGTLRVAAFPSFPPRGAPSAEIAIDAPVFPQAYELTGLPPGRYFVLAMVDRDPADGDRYRPAIDPGGVHGGHLSPRAVTVDATLGAAGIDVDLQPPDPGSPWNY